MEIMLPAGSVTGVGSLPFTDPRRALRFVADHCPTLPFWPQLPNRHPHEGVIAQGLGALAELLEPAASPYCWRIRPSSVHRFASALEEEAARLIPETAAGFFAFRSAFRGGEFPAAVAIKAQSEGPVTLAHCVLVEGQPLARQVGWLDRFASFLARQAAWQIASLQQLGKPVLFVLDEPAISLALAGASPEHTSAIVTAINHVLNAVHEAGALAGLHCCAPLPLPLVRSLNLDLVSFDAHLPIDDQGWLEVASSIMARSGYLAFGLVPTNPASGLEPSDLFAQWLRLAASAGDITEVASRTIVTATCGLALTSPSHTTAVFNRCREAGERIKQLTHSTFL